MNTILETELNTAREEGDKSGFDRACILYQKDMLNDIKETNDRYLQGRAEGFAEVERMIEGMMKDTEWSDPS